MANDALWFDELEMSGEPERHPFRTDGRTGGLWARFHPHVGNYLGGLIEMKPVLVFPNILKRPRENGPDWCVFRGRPRKPLRGTDWNKVDGRLAE